MSGDSCMMLCCASCGIAEIDDIKLKKCTICDLVRYCSDECERDHQSQHEEACKKRAAELRDELLFKQPESTHLGDCPICYLPLPLDTDKSSINDCCSKRICNGCVYADLARMGKGLGVLKHTCAFCRAPSVVTDEEADKRRVKRIEAHDPFALRREGDDKYTKGDYSGAFEYLIRAAELGDANAHYRLAYLYFRGKGVEKDIEKKIYHLEEAAIAGHPNARYHLGIHLIKDKEKELCHLKDNIERAVKHLVIAAKQGYDDSIKHLMGAFKRGFVSKEDLAAALRAHQAAVDATKSPQRKIADDLLGEGGIHEQLTSQVKRLSR